MRYLMLIYSNEAQDMAASPDVQGKVYAEYMELEKELGKNKVKLAGEALQPTSTATTPRPAPTIPAWPRGSPPTSWPTGCNRRLPKPST